LPKWADGHYSMPIRQRQGVEPESHCSHTSQLLKGCGVGVVAITGSGVTPSGAMGMIG